MSFLLLAADTIDITNPAVLAGSIILALQAAVAYFFKSMASDFKEMTKTVNSHDSRIAVLEAGQSRIERKLDV